MVNLPDSPHRNQRFPPLASLHRLPHPRPQLPSPPPKVSTSQRPPSITAHLRSNGPPPISPSPPTDVSPTSPPGGGSFPSKPKLPISNARLLVVLLLYPLLDLLLLPHLPIPVETLTLTLTLISTSSVPSHGEGVQRPSGDLPLRQRFRPPPPPRRPSRLPTPRLRLHLLLPSSPLHVLRHRLRPCPLLLLRPRLRLLLLLLHLRPPPPLLLLRRRAAPPRGARHQHPPDLAQDPLHPQPLPRQPQPPRGRRPLRPVSLPHGLRALPAPRREAPLRDHPRVGHRRRALSLRRLQHACGAPRQPRPLPLRLPAQLLHAPNPHLLRGVPLHASTRGRGLRVRRCVRPVVDEGVHRAARGACVLRGRAPRAHRLRVLPHLHPLLAPRHLLMKWMAPPPPPITERHMGLEVLCRFDMIFQCHQ